MSTPVDELPEPTYAQPPGQYDPHYLQGRSVSLERPSLPTYNISHHPQRQTTLENPSDEEGTMIGDGDDQQHHQVQVDPQPHHQRPRRASHLTVQDDYFDGEGSRIRTSHSQTREQAFRLDDDLALLKIERQVSRQAAAEESSTHDAARRKHEEPIDEFDVATNPIHETTQVYKPIDRPSTGFAKFMKQLHKSNFLIRYVTYIAPLCLILLIPLLLGALVYKTATVGGVYLFWFMVWLEIVWLTLWAGRILAKCLPWPIGLASSLFTSNSKKWRDMGKQLELPATLFFWWLAIEVSFLPTMTNHQACCPGSNPVQGWMNTMNKVLVSIFVGVVLNFAEKIIIQLIAISFHLRTYADRIEINKFQISSLTKLYEYSKNKIAMDDDEFEAPSGIPTASGTRTPRALFNDAINNATKTSKMAFNRFGDVAGHVAGDFTGRKVEKSTHPAKVVLTLLNSTGGSQVLARRLYRTFAREETETVYADDLRNAFDNDDEADAAFTMFDKDMNGDISMEELEAVCVEIGRERKSITASLKDLDSVVAKLDDVLIFLVFIITVLVFISLISTSAAAVVTSAGSAVLALSWLFSATAQEFLQSTIFVFVKHPFDVGDRVTIYGSTGSKLTGDDYFVKEISLLYTEFKKMEGHIVQAPNTYLNTLFILNQRRSGGLAEAVSISIKFGTTLEQIEGLRSRLLEFVQAEKREFQSNILTELRDIVDVHSMSLNVVFFYKSNWQNEGLRLARRNKFICALMVTIQEMGIEGPQMRYPGQRQSFPVYLQNVPHTSVGPSYGGHPDNPMGVMPEEVVDGAGPQDPPFVAPPPIIYEEGATPQTQAPPTRMRSVSTMRSARPRAESLAAMNKRVDFSLGARNFAAGDLTGDVYNDREAPRIPMEFLRETRERARASEDAGSRTSRDLARTTSRDMSMTGGNLARRATTDSQASRFRSSSVHRNRFLGKLRPSHDEARLMESGMADIPENPRGSGSRPESAAQNRSPAAVSGADTGYAPLTQRLDPRSGMISPAAWRSDTGHSSIGGESSVLVDTSQQQRPQSQVRSLSRSQTEKIEMRPL